MSGHSGWYFYPTDIYPEIQRGLPGIT
jgi:hypothetical protein